MTAERRPDPASVAEVRSVAPVLRAIVVALALGLIGFGAARGASALRDWILDHPHYRFAADDVVLVDPPAWSDGTVAATVRSALRPLDGASFVHPAFAAALRGRLAGVPWVRDVTRVDYRAGRVALDLALRAPIARLDGPAHAEQRFIDRDGVLLPDAGRWLVVPTVRAGAALDAHQLRVVARDVARLSRTFRGRAPADARAAMLWSTWAAVDVHVQTRHDGGANTLLSLEFRRADDGGTCRIEWGRGELERRPGDLPFGAKLANLERILYHNPGWRDIERGVVAYLRPAIIRVTPDDAMVVQRDPAVD